MAQLDLSIELDGHKTRYFAGETVSGRVIVRTSNPVKCDALMAKLEWFTHGKGNPEAEAVESANLFSGQWHGGEVLAYPFRFTAPRTPISYAGEILNIDYRVHAEADIPWAFDPEAAQTIEIVHGPPPTGLVISSDHKVDNSDSSCISCSCLMLVVGGTMAAFAAAGSSGSGEVLGIWGMGIAIVGLIAFFGLIGRYLAERKAGKVNLEIEQATTGQYRAAGNADQLRVALTVRAGSAVNHATAKLEVREEVVRGSGTSKRTFQHHIFATDTRLAQTAPGRYEGMLQLPVGTAPCSFYALSNELVWELQCHIDIPNSPDWKETVKLEAQPAQ